MLHHEDHRETSITPPPVGSPSLEESETPLKLPAHYGDPRHRSDPLEDVADVALPHEVLVDEEGDVSEHTTSSSAPDTITKLRALAMRVTVMGHAAMGAAAAGLGTLSYQLTQSHCFECWGTRLLPAAVVSIVAGYLCRTFDTIKARVARELRSSSSADSAPDDSAKE